MPDDTADLVTRGATLKREILAKQEALKDIEQLLQKKGPGTYENGKGASCAVVGEGTTFTVKSGDVETIKTAAGDHFAKLFEKGTSYKPVKAFRELAAALLTKAGAKKLLGLVEVPRAGFVKWSA